MFDANNGDSGAATGTSSEQSASHQQNQAENQLESFKSRVREMEEEQKKLKLMQDEMETGMQLSPPASTTGLSLEEKQEIDARSIYVGNVDYTATADELERHFHGCGSINRVTILQDRFTGHPKGYAYVEFADSDAVETASALEGSLFKGRQIKIMAKRTNRPGLSSTNRPPRGGFRGRGGFGRGGFHGHGRGGFRPMRRPYPRRGGYHPYLPY